MQNGRRLLCWGAGALAAVLLASAPSSAGISGKAKADAFTAPGLVRIDDAARHKKLEMAPALFPHEKHTEALAKAGKDCAVCHTGLDGKTPFAFQGLPGKLDAKALEKKFHNACLSCHSQMDAGPDASECRVCHTAKAPKVGAALPVKFSKSVHYLHVSSKLIPAPADAAGQDNCGACHHVYDKAQGKLVWAKGQEDACAACHGLVADKDTPALQTAAHDSCVKCHLAQTAAQKKAGAAQIKSGPVDCVACHTAAGQAKFPVLKDVPRLLRGQPDATVILPPLSKDAKAGMTPVAFNHKAHEAAAESCRVCHHVRIDDKGCAVCHTLGGAADGKFVQLSQAMHDPVSEHSCVGCHQRTARQTKDCAGCHAGVKPLADRGCAVCHAPFEGVKDAAELAGYSKTRLQKFAEMELAARADVKPLAPADMPETVTIGLLSNEYEAAVMPHRKIYQTLLKGYADNALAGRFHSTPEAACAACHHNVPLSDLRQPAKCASCHGSQADKLAVDKNVPSLKAAYHQQCMACHARMDVKPVATDCQGCHAPRQQAGR